METNATTSGCRNIPHTNQTRCTYNSYQDVSLGDWVQSKVSDIEGCVAKIESVYDDATGRYEVNVTLDNGFVLTPDQTRVANDKKPLKYTIRETLEKVSTDVDNKVESINAERIENSRRVEEAAKQTINAVKKSVQVMTHSMKTLFGPLDIS